MEAVNSVRLRRLRMIMALMSGTLCIAYVVIMNNLNARRPEPGMASLAMEKAWRAEMRQDTLVFLVAFSLIAIWFFRRLKKLQG